MPCKTPPYTFSLYVSSDLLTNIYGAYSDAPLCGDVCNGVAPCRRTAVERAAELGARVAWKGPIDVIVWRYGKAVLRGDLATFVAEHAPQCAA